MDPAFNYWALQVWLAAVAVMEFLSDLLFGYTYTRGWRGEREAARRDYSRAAQLASVVWFAHYQEIIDPKGMDNFFLRHERYVHPALALKISSASLMFVDEEVAAFCVAEDGKNQYDTKEFPFLFIAQTRLARNLLLVPLSSFHRLAEEAGDPRHQVAVFGMTARCGSTLMAQVMNRVPNTRSISEPWALVSLYLMFADGRIDSEEHRALVRSSVRLLAKVEPGSGLERVAIKLTMYSNPQLRTIHELFPDFLYFFTARHPLPSLLSYRKVYKTLQVTLYLLLGIVHRKILRLTPMPISSGRHDRIAERRGGMFIKQLDESSAILYGSCLAVYHELRHVFSHVVLYENLTSDPEAEIARLFHVMGVPEELVPVGASALDRHSQNGMFSSAAGGDVVVVPEEGKRLADRTFKDFGFPFRVDSTFEEFQQFFHK